MRSSRAGRRAILETGHVAAHLLRVPRLVDDDRARAAMAKEDEAPNQRLH